MNLISRNLYCTTVLPVITRLLLKDSTDRSDNLPGRRIQRVFTLLQKMKSIARFIK